MKRGKIIELENFLFKSLKDDSKKKLEYLFPTIIMSDIMGVLIDLKPAARIVFTEKDLKKLNVFKFDDLLHNLGLESSEYVSHSLRADARHYADDGSKKETFHTGIEHYLKVFIAKTSENLNLAYNASMRFEKVRPVLTDEEYKEATIRMGEILGYPKTAIEYYVDENNKDETSSWRYFIHSAKYGKEEFEAYDLKLNKALAEYAPKTAKILSSDKNESWLSYSQS